jgi:hypothetical protein
MKGKDSDLYEALFRYFPGRKAQSEYTGVPVEFRNENLPNTSLGRCCCTTLFGVDNHFVEIRRMMGTEADWKNSSNSELLYTE